MYGGDVNVTSTGGGIDLGSQNLFITSTTQIAYGIYTAGHSDVSVIAHDNVSINGSRIAAYDGGNVFVKSLFGNVSVWQRQQHLRVNAHESGPGRIRPPTRFTAAEFWPSACRKSFKLPARLCREISRF